MKRRTTGSITRAAAALALVFGLGALFAGKARGQDRTFDWSGQVAAGQTLELKGVNGSVNARPASGSGASVAARIEGHGDDPSEVRIEVVEHGGGVTLCAVYPDEDNECAPGDGGSLSSEGSDVEVRFEALVPQGVHFTGRTVNGEVDASDLRGDVTARTVNGAIRLSTTGSAAAHTVNGTIEAEMGALSGAGPYRFETVNGGITLTLPEGTGADVEARTLNGGVTTDFPLTVQGRFGPRSLQGTIGGGGPGLRLETTNGSIELRRAG